MPYFELDRGGHPLTRRRGDCLEWIPDPNDPTGTRAVPCGRPGHTVRLKCPAGRRDAVGGPFCDEHGGAAAAEADAKTSWGYLAPAEVGGDDAVDDAGHLHLDTRHAYLVIRQTPEAQGGTWLAWLGLGSMLEPIRNPRRRPARRGGKKHIRAGAEAAATGTRSFGSREAAEREGRAAWRARIDADVAAIRTARGGTLAWGVPVEPLDEPILIALEQGDSRSAWDVAVALPRRSPAGVSALSGCRPSGEAC